MNGFALLVAVAVLGQTGGAGWDVDKKDQRLAYVIHLTPQDIQDMQTPTGPENKVAEYVMDVPPSVQGRFSKVVVRVDTSMPPRQPPEEAIRDRYPLLIPSSSSPPVVSTSISLGDKGGAGWEINAKEKELEYILHITPQEILQMQTPLPGQSKVAECVFEVPPAIQGRFKTIVARIDAAAPARYPTEDKIAALCPLLIPASSGIGQPNSLLQQNSGNFANIDATDRDRNAAPVRTTASGSNATLTDVAQNRTFNSPSLSSPALGGDRNREAPIGATGAGQLSSAPLGSSLQSSQRSDGVNGWNAGTNNGFSGGSTNSGLTNNSTFNASRDPASLGIAGNNSGTYGTGTYGSGTYGSGTNGMGTSGLGTGMTGLGTSGNGFGSNGMSGNSFTNTNSGIAPNYNGNYSNNTGTMGTGTMGTGTMGTGALNSFGQNTYGNTTGSNMTSGMNQTNPYAAGANSYLASGQFNNGQFNNGASYGNTGALNNGLGMYSNPLASNFQNPNGYVPTPYAPQQGLTNNSLYQPQLDYLRLASNQGIGNATQQSTVPFPGTASSGPATLPQPGSGLGGVSGRARSSRDGYSTLNGVGSEYDPLKQSYLPIFFLLSFVVNLYAGIYLYKLRDRYRALLASVRAGIES